MRNQIKAYKKVFNLSKWSCEEMCLKTVADYLSLLRFSNIWLHFLLGVQGLSESELQLWEILKGKVLPSSELQDCFGKENEALGKMLKKRLSRKLRVARGTRMESMGKVRLLWSSGASGFLCLHRLLCKEVRVAMSRPSLEISRGYWCSLTSEKDNLSHHHVCSDGSREFWKSLWKAWVSPGDRDISEGKAGSQKNRHLSWCLWQRISLLCPVLLPLKKCYFCIWAANEWPEIRMSQQLWQ